MTENYHNSMKKEDDFIKTYHNSMKKEDDFITMRVRDLTNILHQCDPDATVVIENSNRDWYPGIKVQETTEYGYDKIEKVLVISFKEDKESLTDTENGWGYR